LNSNSTDFHFFAGPDLSALEIHNSTDLDNTTLGTMLEYTNQLKRLSVVACERITALKFPATLCKTLEDIELAQLRVNDDGLVQLDQRFANNLKTLRLGGLELITGISIIIFNQII